MTVRTLYSTFASARPAPAKQSGRAESIPILSAATSMSGVSNVWVSAGTVPGVYQVTASYPGFTNATADQLMADPVFRHSPETILAGGNQSQSQIDALLARGIPALSGPVGSRPIATIPHSRNVDLNMMTGGTCWPRINEPRWNGWRHGDIRAIALPFVFRLFEDFVEIMESEQ